MSKKYSTRKAFGSRMYLGQKSPKVKKFSEELQWLSFGELREKVRLIND